MPLWVQQQVVADPPEVRGPFTLVAAHDSAVGHNAFAYNKHGTAGDSRLAGRRYQTALCKQSADPVR